MSYIVAGWYTPDYWPWAVKLVESLNRFDIPHDFVQVPKRPDGWEANTMMKAAQVQAAMDRHPDKTIVFLDVDCTVHAPLDNLVSHVQADVAFYVRVKRRRNGDVKWGGIRSGTLVLRPTPAARLFVARWIEEGKSAPYGDVDQNTLMLALGRSPMCSFQGIHAMYCATRSDNVFEPVIFHDSASKKLPKIGNLQRRLRYLVGMQPAA